MAHSTIPYTVRIGTIKKIILFLFFSLFLTLNSNAREIDSLLNKLKTSKEDKDKVKLLTNISYRYSDINPTVGIKYAKEALTLALKLNFEMGEANSYSCIAVHSTTLGDLKQGEQYFSKAEKIFKKLKWFHGLAFVLSQRSTIYIHKEQYDEALRLMLQALKIYDQEKKLHDQSEMYSGIGMVLSKMRRYDEAEVYFRKAIALKQKLDEKTSLSLAYLNMGSMMFDKNELKQATQCFESAMVLQKEIGDSLIIACCKLNLGSIYLASGKFNRAIAEGNECFRIYNNLKDTVSMGLALKNIGNAYVEMQQWDSAIFVSQQVIKLSEGFEDKEALRASYLNLCRAYKGKKDFERALKYNELFYTLDSTVNNVQVGNKISLLKEQFEAEKRDQEIILLKEKEIAANSLLERKKLQTIIAVLSAVLLIAILSIIMIRNRNRKKQQLQELEKNKAIFEQQALRAQMNPHFIFNALNSIQHFILENETQYAYDYLAKFSKLIRQVLNNSQRSDITLKDELDLLKLYIELEHRRFENRFDYEINCPAELPVDEIKIPVMLIQPFVENAIWHGIMNLDKNKKGLVKVNFELHESQLKITVEDNGVGREEAAKRKENSEYQSMGMLFTQKRLALFKTISKQESKIEITDMKDENNRAKGTKVDIYITVNN